MPVVEESVVIARPPQEVFDFLAKFENLSVYDAFVTASGQVGGGSPGLGTRGWGTTRYMGQQFDWTVEFTEFEPPRRMVSRSVQGKRDVTATFTLEPDDRGTRLTERLEIGTMGGPPRQAARSAEPTPAPGYPWQPQNLGPGAGRTAAHLTAPAHLNLVNSFSPAA